MTSLRQIAANRRNASKSTGPATEAGKERSRRNAVRHGLTAETVISGLEDAEDYKLFEAAVTADFNPETAVERELVLRLASLLWRLRRAISIEAGLFEASNEDSATADQTTEPPPANGEPVVQLGAFRLAVAAKPTWSEPRGPQTQSPGSNDAGAEIVAPGCSETSDLASRFLRLAALDNGAFERLGRYETALWRQACQTIFVLDVLRRQNLDTKWLPRRSRSGPDLYLPRSIFSRS